MSRGWLKTAKESTDMIHVGLKGLTSMRRGVEDLPGTQHIISMTTKYKSMLVIKKTMLMYLVLDLTPS